MALTFPKPIHNTPSAEKSVHAPPASNEAAEDVDYFPMFWSSAQATLVTLIGQVATSLYLALSWGASVELRLWRDVLPYMALNASQQTFEAIIRWSSIATAAVLILFSIMSFVRQKRLQVQAGRAFAWIDVALIGLLNLTRVWFFVDFATAEPWMYFLVLIGTVGFGVSAAVIWIDYSDQTNADDPLPLAEIQ